MLLPPHPHPHHRHVQCSHSLVLWPQSSTSCVDTSSASDASSSSSASASSPSLPSYPSTSLIPRSNLSSSVTGRRRWLAVGMASRSSLLSPSSSYSPLPPGILKCSSSSVQLLSIGMFGSVLQIWGSSSATSEVKLSRSIALSTCAASTLMTTAGFGFVTCWIWPLTVARVFL